jgi:predicted transcriptional regulator
MAATSLKLPDELKRRIELLAARVRTTRGIARALRRGCRPVRS